MSETVWKAEAEAGLVGFIGGFLGIGAKVRLPDEDLKTEEFPCATVYWLFDAPNEHRRQYSRFEPYVAGRDLEKGEALLAERPMPVDARYQLDFWSLSNRQLNEIAGKWTARCGGYFNLDCEDASGNVRSIFCRQAGNLRNGSQGHTDRGRKVRVFNAGVDYTVWLEIFERETRAVRTVGAGGPVFRLRAGD